MDEPEKEGWQGGTVQEKLTNEESMEHKKVADKGARGNEKIEQVGRKYKEGGQKLEIRQCEKRRGGWHTIGQVEPEGDITNSRVANTAQQIRRQHKKTTGKKKYSHDIYRR